MRLIWTVLFGASVTLLFGAIFVRDRGRVASGRVKRLLTVEEAVRWRPE
jgi:hypothetical protein